MAGSSGSGGASVGMFVADDIATNPTTADIRELDLNNSSTAFTVAARTWSAYNGTASSSTFRTIQAPFLRMRCNGTTCTTEVSTDGVTWLFMDTRTLAFTPSYFGLMIGTADNAVTVYGYFRFFRVFSGAGTSGADGSSIGGFI